MLAPISRQAPWAEETDLMVRERTLTMNEQWPQDKDNSFHTGQWGPLSEAHVTCDHSLSLSRCNRLRQICNVTENCCLQSEQKNCHPPCEQNLGSPLPLGCPRQHHPKQQSWLVRVGAACLGERGGENGTWTVFHWLVVGNLSPWG